MAKFQREPDSSHFDELLTMVYESSIDSEGWHPFLLRLSEIVQSNAALLRVENLKDGDLGFRVNTYQDDTYFSLYQNYYHQIDPLIGFIKKLPTGTMVRTADYYDYSRLFNTEFFVDYMQPQDHDHALGGFIDRENNIATTLGLQRSFKQDSFSDEQVALVQRLTPHLKRALKIGRHLAALQVECEQKSRVTDQLHTGTIVLDQHYRPLWMNTSAECLIKSNQGLKVGERGLQGNSSVETKKLHQLLDSSSGDKIQSSAPFTGQLLLKPSVHPPLILLSIPYSESMGINYVPNSKASVILFICQQNQSNKNAHILSQLFNLTTAETRLLASIGVGDTLEFYASKWDISKNTARSQLRAVLAKTQMSRQADLILLYQQISLNSDI